MTHSPAPPVAPANLTDAVNLLSAALGNLEISNTARIQSLEEAIHESQTYLHRKAARNKRDRACYRIGSALEPNGGHELDDIALAGFDHLGAIGLLLLMPLAILYPGESFSGLLRRLFESAAGPSIRAWGEWSRRTWLRDLYLAETVTFLATKTGSDPKQAWRNQKPTARQEHIIREISRIDKCAEPTFGRRGEAFDWIKARGGNPRYWDAPPKPPLLFAPGVSA